MTTIFELSSHYCIIAVFILTVVYRLANTLFSRYDKRILVKRITIENLGKKPALIELCSFFNDILGLIHASCCCRATAVPNQILSIVFSVNTTT